MWTERGSTRSAYRSTGGSSASRRVSTGWPMRSPRSSATPVPVPPSSRPSSSTSRRCDGRMAGGNVDQALSVWAAHRRRAEALRERHAYAGEVLTCYLALLDAWEQGADLARTQRPQPQQVAQWATERVLPSVVAATEAAGPEKLARATRGVFDEGQLGLALVAWLAGEELAPVERYLARASLWPALVVLDEDAGLACVADASPRGTRHCPRCGGLPQLSYRLGGEDHLTSGPRSLMCARCAHSWSYSSSTCPSCGETTGSKRTVYTEQRGGPIVGPDTGNPDADAVQPMFAHLRIDACASCERYLIDVDLGRDTLAVPEVDELAALPLDLYATEHGLSKITPNLMGF